MMNSYSLFNVFSAQEWAALCSDTPLTISEQDLFCLRSLGDTTDFTEVENIYLPLTKLLLKHFDAMKQLGSSRKNFLKQSNNNKVPFIIGISGSVAVGKSTTARLLKELLEKNLPNLKVDLVTSDGFLYPNERLESLGLMKRKGFPESYDIKSLLRFLASVKLGEPLVQAPVYSHLVYDVVPHEYTIVDCPDILIFEGINLLQIDSKAVNLKNSSVVKQNVFVSDFLDFAIYLDAPTDLLSKWYVDRFMKLRDTAFKNPQSFFKSYANWEDKKAKQYAENIWEEINLKNLKENIKPTQVRADLVLHKGDGHKIRSVSLRKF